MAKDKSSKQPEESTNRLHPRNAHQGRYDFAALVAVHPILESFVRPNGFGDQSIDFANPEAVLALNTALLKLQYKVSYWEMPSGYLCPPVPGRADYLHYLADLLAESNEGEIPTGPSIRCYDIGVGANLIYPIVGIQTYGWSFIGSEVDAEALEVAEQIRSKNDFLEKNLELRLQKAPKHFFNGALKSGELVDVTICNPPFHASKEDAETASLRKLKNLKGSTEKVLNFGGKGHELWYPGGELKFIEGMMKESHAYGQSCLWFSTLVSKAKHLKPLYHHLKKVRATAVRTLPMGQGNKTSRILAWTFQTPRQQQAWSTSRWTK